jgi:hypothetical protein
MNAITKAIEEIHYSIPIEVLYAGFTVDEPPELVNFTSLSEKIRSKCIKPRVLVDANIVGGVHIIVPISAVAPSFWAEYYTVYKIPAELINNREIVSALNLVFIPYNQTVGPNMAVNSINTITIYGNYQPATMSTADRIGTAHQDIGILTNTHIELIGYNTVAIYQNYMALTNYGLRCLVSNDEDLNNISPRSYKAFAKLAILAVKSYIYNKLIVKLNMGYLHGGQELGQFKAIIDSYEGAEEEYNRVLKEEWMAVAAMNDTANYQRILKTMIHPGI